MACGSVLVMIDLKGQVYNVKVKWLKLWLTWQTKDANIINKYVSDSDFLEYFDSLQNSLKNIVLPWFSFYSDLDECQLGTHNCHKDATCTNTYGLWNCTCNTAWKGEGTGFEGNGTHCYGKW